MRLLLDNKPKQYNHWEVDKNNADEHTIKACNFLGMKGNIRSIETSNNEILSLLDKYSGIDLINIDDDCGRMFGMAVRIQPIEKQYKPWNTFTIRYERHTGTKTEYIKRTEAIKNEDFYPKYTIQAYTKNGEIVSAAIIMTKQLYEFIDEYINTDLVEIKTSDNSFLVVKWQDIIDKNFIMITNPGIKKIEQNTEHNWFGI